MSDLFNRLCKLLEISKTRTPPYRPCANGQTERYNRTILQVIPCYMNNVHFQRHWDRHLQLIDGTIRATVDRQTGFAANKMMLGRKILQPVDIMMGVSEHQVPRDPCDYVEELESVLRKVHVIARENLHEAQNRQKRTYDLRIHHHAYDVGDFVYMIDSSTKIEQSKKLQKPGIGPFVVNEKLSSVLYRIKNRRKENVVDHDRLKKCSDRTIPIWLTRLRHAVTKDMSLPKQDREEGTDEDACPLESFFSDEGPDILSSVSGDQGSSDNNPIATIPDIPSPGSRSNARERRQVRLPKALTDYGLSYRRTPFVLRSECSNLYICYF